MPFKFSVDTNLSKSKYVFMEDHETKTSLRQQVDYLTSENKKLTEMLHKAYKELGVKFKEEN